MLIVVDSNVLISGLMGSPTCRQVIVLIKRDILTAALSPVLFEELCFVINRPKFHTLITNAEKMSFLQFLRARALFVEPKVSVDICRDREDNKVLECALAARVDTIVTGDNDLLTLSPFKGIKILPPGQFLKLLKPS